jgi:hypothetical protein
MSDQSQPPPGQPPFEVQKWLHELRIRDAERAHDRTKDFSLSVNQAAIDNGNLALRTAVLINGGASVSVLAFVGGLVAQGKIEIGPSLVEISSALIWFASGVAAAALAIGFAYFTNYCIAVQASHLEFRWEHPYVVPTSTSKRWLAFAHIFQVTAVVLGSASIGLFVIGMVEVRDAISHFTSNRLMNPKSKRNPTVRDWSIGGDSEENGCLD